MYDYHTHSSLSDDSRTPMDAMIERAISLGIKELAVTDHFDPGYNDADYPFLLDFDLQAAIFREMEARYGQQIKLVKGMEVGIQLHLLEECAAAARDHDYDFIIGSFHSLEGSPIYGMDFESLDKPAFLRRFYTYMYDCLQAYTDYDVIGHFSIIDRYIGDQFHYTPYMDIIEEILKKIIQDGKGLEINTSNYRYHMSVSMPRTEILKRYRELGGEVLTIGSDAHHADALLDHFAEAKRS